MKKLLCYEPEFAGISLLTVSLPTLLPTPICFDIILSDRFGMAWCWEVAVPFPIGEGCFIPAKYIADYYFVEFFFGSFVLEKFSQRLLIGPLHIGPVEGNMVWIEVRNWKFYG